MDFREIFNNTVTVDIQSEFVRLLYRVYPEVKRDMDEREYPPAYYHDLYAQMLRPKVDMHLVQLAKRFPTIITARIATNNTHNNHHAIVVSGSIIMTASAVQLDTDTPRLALYRKNLAVSNQFEMEYSEEQNALISPAKLDDPSAANIVYAVILHGPAEAGERYLPGFIHIAFLDKRMNRLCSDIDLMIKYRDVVTEMLTPKGEKITEDIRIELNRQQSNIVNEKESNK